MADMGFIEKIKKVLSSPSEFFDQIKYEEGIGNAFKYQLIVSLVFVIGLFLITSLPISLSIFHLLKTSITYVIFIPISIAIYFLFIISSFINAGIMHIFIKLFGGKGDYSATYKVLVYGNTPTMIFGWMSLIGVIFSVYSFYLSLKGISKLHEMSMLRAFLAFFIVPFIIGLILFIALGAIIFTYMKGAFTPTPYI